MDGKSVTLLWASVGRPVAGDRPEQGEICENLRNSVNRACWDRVGLHSRSIFKPLSPLVIRPRRERVKNATIL